MRPNHILTDEELAEQLRLAAAKLDEGRLTASDAESLLHLAAAFFERTAVLKHESNLPVPTPEPVAVTAEPQPITKQINLLDVIEEMEAVEEMTAPAGPDVLTEEAEEKPVYEAVSEVVMKSDYPEPSVEPLAKTVVAPEPAQVVLPQDPEPVAGPVAQTKPPVPKAEPSAAAESINDKLSSGMPKRSLADKLALTPLADIKKAISLNLKFQFINELFGGNAAEFEAAIQKLNSAADAKSAFAILEHELLMARGWDAESKVFLDLHTLVERRYL